MRILGVVPARGGSTRIPRKNLQIVGGITLVERAIEHARGSKLLDDWVVSTDDDAIERSVPPRYKTYLRNREGDGPMHEVLREVLGNWPSWTMNPDCDAVVTIQPTSPLRTSEDIDGCIRQWIEFETGNALVSVNEATGLRNGAVYVTPVSMLRWGLVFEPTTDMAYEMPAERSLDINTPSDLEEARRLLG